MDEKEIIRQELECNKDGKVCQTHLNILTVMQTDPNLKNKICFDELSYSPYIKGRMPWDNEPDREWTNCDDKNIFYYLENNYGLVSNEKIMNCIEIESKNNKFNPVIDHLESLPKWDGIKRIKKLLPDYLGAEDNSYTAEVLKLFMLGAISRAYKPGCKFDYMMVLVGAQGIGKSYFIRALSMCDKWLDDNFSSIESDKAPEKLRGKWIIELAELLAVKNKREFEGVKAFITSQVDNYRPPYARRTEHRQRKCVMVGTTNDFQFLSDPTGNRRFLPVEVRKEYVKKNMWTDENDFKETIKQAWAEALYIYKNEKPLLILPDEVEGQAQQYRKAFTEEDTEAVAIQTWLDNNPLVTRVTATLIWQRALEKQGYPGMKESKTIHSIMRNNVTGWRKAGKQRDSFNDNKIQITYERILTPEI